MEKIDVNGELISGFESTWKCWKERIALVEGLKTPSWYPISSQSIATFHEVQNLQLLADCFCRDNFLSIHLEAMLKIHKNA